MATYTNISDGPRGLHTDDGIVMVDPGKDVDVTLLKGETINKEWFAKGSAADVLAPSAGAGAGDAAELDELRDQVATLTKQVEDGTAANATLTKERDEAVKSVATLTKQVEDGTAANATLTKERDEAVKSVATLTKQVEDLTKAADKK